MKSSLKTLSRIQKFNIDEQRKLLNEQLSAEEKLVQNLNKLQEQFENEKKFAAENPNYGDFGAYVKRYMRQRGELENALQRVWEKIETIRDIIADMFKEQKTYEIVDKNRKERAAHEEEIKTQKTLDEIGTNNYIKHSNK